MPVSPTYPGVYVQEVPSGVRTIAGVSTSVAMFIGQSKRGPIGKPVLCLSYADFSRSFGEDTSTSQLTDYVKLFFLNGGTQCYVVRIASGAQPSGVTLLNEAGAAALILTAKDAGLAGEDIRASVSYSGAQPEATFNIDLFRWELQSGVRSKAAGESWKNLSMNPNSPLYAPTFLSQNSKLVNASLPGAPAATSPGFSVSGRPVAHENTDAAFQAAWAPILSARHRFEISVDGSPYVDINLNQPALDVAGMAAANIRTAGLPAEIENRITAQFAAKGHNGVNVDVDFMDGPTPLGGSATDITTLLRIRSTSATGDVYVRPAASDDLAIPLMLGTQQGGLEVSAFAGRRPAPNGISLLASNPSVLVGVGSLAQSAIAGVTLEQAQAAPATGYSNVTVGFNLATVAPGASTSMYRDAIGGSPNGNNNGVREKLSLIAAAINARRSSEPLFPWSAEVAGSRLTIVPAGSTADNFRSTGFAMAGAPAGSFYSNVKNYTLGAGGLNTGRQQAGTTGSDGSAPQSSDYDAAYLTIDREVDLFNLMVLPPSNEPGAATPQSLYGNASVFCQKRRAFLIMDPPPGWTSAQSAIDATSGVNSLRTGLVKQYAALYYPRVTIDDRGKKVNIGPSAAIAGLYARTDSTRGVWKAPAGTEADLRGITGVEYRFSDGENGVLNPRAVNTIRVFPNGIVSWGARTMDGDDDFASEYKYIPIRRLALFMEESLYRGLKWVVFEPNDEPLWAQIRLNVGAFMHNLFRQGAFQGQTPRDAYFVKCDRETTTQNDRNLGMVNIWVGFAPLKPAEFVILYLQQMAGQVEA